jgi:hypothetical protein
VEKDLTFLDARVFPREGVYIGLPPSPRWVKFTFSQSHYLNITMKFNLAIAGAVLPSLAMGFPQMMGASKEDMLKMYQERSAEMERVKREPQSLTSLLGGAVGTLANDVRGLLGTCDCYHCRRSYVLTIIQDPSLKVF